MKTTKISNRHYKLIFKNFAASKFNFVSRRKYEILAFKRAYHFALNANALIRTNQNNDIRENCMIQYWAVKRHSRYFGEAIAENSIDEMRSIPV